MIRQFCVWALPRAIRTDNGEPFGVTTRDVVPIMSLWLKAYGVDHILNRPRQPQHNAKVERAQGTTSRWAEVHKCANIAQLQQWLTEACSIQREKYPVTRLGNVSRAERYKSLFDKKRPFEKAVFDERKAYDYLAKAVMPRKVSSSGNITIYSKVFSVEQKNKGKVMMVKFDPDDVQWFVFYQSSDLCKTLPDVRFSKENLFSLTCQ
jgi:transposase InsO family protein